MAFLKDRHQNTLCGYARELSSKSESSGDLKELKAIIKELQNALWRQDTRIKELEARVKSLESHTDEEAEEGEDAEETA
ncbi:hypothetical protein PoB_006974800 [Plakobranchus ocellatus]|uniref:Uncharacterized protein n=1 Tax=Plakobranchus ocellatus TaxID=259542 RepID=A0AAV4DG97_9GAST|nr:hypothetical protein PoB_006974800 [Plakobranchus ocellatus]